MSVRCRERGRPGGYIRPGGKRCPGESGYLVNADAGTGAAADAGVHPLPGSSFLTSLSSRYAALSGTSRVLAALFRGTRLLGCMGLLG